MHVCWGVKFRRAIRVVWFGAGLPSDFVDETRRTTLLGISDSIHNRETAGPHAHDTGTAEMCLDQQGLYGI